MDERAPRRVGEDAEGACSAPRLRRDSPTAQRAHPLMPFRAWRLAAASLPVATALACSDAGVSMEPSAATTAPIIKGTNSDATQDAVVLLQHFSSVELGECTGTLIATNLV